jgi:hypothetical protein
MPDDIEVLASTSQDVARSGDVRDSVVGILTVEKMV